MKRAIVFSGNLQNVGDLALLLQTAYGLRFTLNVERILVRQWAPVHPDVGKQLKIHNIEVLDGKNLLSCLRSLPGALLLFGGGQMVRDNASLASISAAALMMRLSRVVGGKCAAIGCGASRIKKPGHLAVWKFIAGQLLIFAARDRSSLEVIASFRQPIKIVQTADLIHFTSPLTSGLLDQSREGVLVAPCEDVSEERGIPSKLVADIVAAYSRSTGPSRVVLACHDSRPGMDSGIARVIAEELVSRGNETLIHEGFLLDEFFSLYRKTGLVITNRLHSVFFAALANKPIILVDDKNSKTREAAADLGIPLLAAGASIKDVDAAVKLATDRYVIETRAMRMKELSKISGANFSLLEAEIRV